MPTKKTSSTISGMPTTEITKKIANGMSTTSPKTAQSITFPKFCCTVLEIKLNGFGSTATIKTASARKPRNRVILKVQNQLGGVSSTKNGIIAETPGIFSSTKSPCILEPCACLTAPPIETTFLPITALGHRITEPPTATAESRTLPFTVTLPPTATASFTSVPSSTTTSPPIRTLFLASALPGEKIASGKLKAIIRNHLFILLPPFLTTYQVKFFWHSPILLKVMAAKPKYTSIWVISF